MGRPKKHITPKDIIGAVLSENITVKLPIVFPRAEGETEQILALHKRSGVGKETIRRIIKGEVSPRLDNIDAIARALGTTAAKLISTPEEASAGDSSPGIQSMHELQRRAGGAAAD